MIVPEIIKELEVHTGKFPRAAMEEAVEQREVVTPELIRIVEEVAANPEVYAKQNGYMAHMYAMYLLAQFREGRAYRPIIKMFSAPGDTSSELGGDFVADGLAKVLGSVYDGDLGPIQSLIENENAYEFARASAVDSLTVLLRAGQLNRDDLVQYFRALFHGKLSRQHRSYVWDSVVGSVADNGLPELIEEVRQAYADGLADPRVAGLDKIEEVLAKPEKNAWRTDRMTVIDSAIGEMEGWASFKDDSDTGSLDLAERGYDKSLGFNLLPSPVAEPNFVGEPYIRPPKVGRNDPCPCGSGKKYKMCCLKQG